MALGLSGGPAAEVTFERLANPEPGNRLMNHRDYRSHRFSPLDAINKTNRSNSQARLCGAARRVERQWICRGDVVGNRTDKTPVTQLISFGGRSPGSDLSSAE
jgi:hypothetical protein